MAFAPLILMGISTAMSVSAANQQAQGKANMAAYNAGQARLAASRAEAQAKADADQQSRAAQKALGSIRAGYGASGVALEGSAIDILAESTTNAMLDNLSIKNKGYLRSEGLNSEAYLNDRAAQMAGDEGQMKSASALISGASSMYGEYNRVG